MHPHFQKLFMNHNIKADSQKMLWSNLWTMEQKYSLTTLPERIYNPIAAMGFSAMFYTFQLDNTKR